MFALWLHKLSVEKEVQGCRQGVDGGEGVCLESYPKERTNKIGVVGLDILTDAGP